MSKVPLHVLPGFVAAARLRNLSRAAASLHVTVSALSHQMRGLEDRLGQRLFDRGPRGLRLTAFGERLYAQVAPHLDAISAALAPGPVRSPHALSLSVLPSVASGWLIPRLPAFTALHPEVELSLQSTTDVVEFDREDVDAAVRFGTGSWPGLRVHLLWEEWVVPVASPELLKRFPQAERGDFTGVPLLRDFGERWHAWFARFGGTPPARYVAAFDDTEALARRWSPSGPGSWASRRPSSGPPARELARRQELGAVGPAEDDLCLVQVAVPEVHRPRGQPEKPGDRFVPPALEEHGHDEEQLEREHAPGPTPRRAQRREPGALARGRVEGRGACSALVQLEP